MTDLGRIDAQTPVTICVSLSYRDPQGIQRFADAVSNPSSPAYRHFLTPTEVGAKFGPLPTTVQAVSKYLTSKGLQLDLVGKNGLTIVVKGTVGQAESAFSTQINEFRPTADFPGDRNGQLFTYVKPLRLPKSIQALVIDVSGLETFSRPLRRGYMTPPIAQAVYGATPLFTLGSKGQGRTIGISNWDGYRVSNAVHFVNQYSLPTPAGGAGSNITIKTVDGGSGAGNQQGEGDLDIQTVLGVAPLCNLIVYDGAGGDLINVLTRETNDNQADIITESWGWSLDANSKIAAHNLHLSMTAQGITYMAASGDSGTNLGAYTYPNVDPEVLMVGGTKCTTDIIGNRVSEVGWTGSGGGWAVTSDAFNTLPSYQKGTGVPTSINRRLIPDVALNADPATGYVIYFNSGSYVFGGTSAASPTFAAGLADAQQQLINNGVLTASNGVYRMGRVQDLIYSLNGNNTIFFDVTSGANGNLPSGAASSATAGWDFVTGWGAINFNALVTALSGTGLGSVSISPAALEGGLATATGTVHISGIAPSGGQVIQLSGGDSSITFPASVTIAAGGSSATFAITTRAVGTVTTETISATDGTNTKTASLTLNPSPITTLTVAPTSAVGGAKLTGSVTLTRAAAVGGTTVTLSGGDSHITLPASVTVAAGTKTATFQITSTAVSASTPETITATCGSSIKSASFTLTTLTVTGLAFSPAAVTSGANATGTVTLSAAAPNGATVSLSGGDSNITLPGTVSVAANSKTGTFVVNTKVLIGSVVEAITATFGSSTKSANLTINGVKPTKLAFTPITIYGGQSATGTITLSQAAPTGGADVTLTGGDSNISYPATVTVPGGAASATFTVTSSTVLTSVSETITATLGGKTASAALTVRPNGVLSTLAFAPASVAGGRSSVGTVKLTYAAGPGGVTIALSGGDSSVSYPSSVTIGAGATQTTFAITTTQVASNTAEQITATLGSSTARGTVTVLATALTAFTVSPSSVYNGQNVTGTLTLNGPAGTNGIDVAITGGNASVSFPSKVTVAEGATSATFTVSTSTVTANTLTTLTATLVVAKSAQFTIKPDGIVSALTFAPATSPGGVNVTGTIRLTGASGPNGVTVSLSGGDSSISYPATVKVNAGASTATFLAALAPVATTVQEAITASIAPSSARGTVTIQAPALSAFTIAPTSVKGGNSATGTLKLTGVAPTGGITIAITGGDSKISYSGTVTIAAGANVATFTITTTSVGANFTETLSAKLGSVTKAASLKLTP